MASIDILNEILYGIPRKKEEEKDIPPKATGVSLESIYGMDYGKMPYRSYGQVEPPPENWQQYAEGMNRIADKTIRDYTQLPQKPYMEHLAGVAGMLNPEAKFVPMVGAGIAWPSMAKAGGEVLGDAPRMLGKKLPPLEAGTMVNAMREGGPELVHQFVRSGRTPNQYMRGLLNTEGFKDMPATERVAMGAEVERIPRGNTYTGEINITDKARRMENVETAANKKLAESRIVPGDTIRGCGNKCFRCYGLKAADKNCISHAEPQYAELKGTLPADKIFRNGETGDPATDWAWSTEQVKGMIERSPGTSFERNVLAITKLQKLDGYDPVVHPNLQVSLDPLKPEHLATTMRNIVQLKETAPWVNMELRIRTLASTDPKIAAAQREAIDFAKNTGIPVRETKLRFRSQDDFEFASLDPNMYERVGNQYKLKESMLKNEQGIQLQICGEKMGKKGLTCSTCRQCEEFIDGQMVKE